MKAPALFLIAVSLLTVQAAYGAEGAAKQTVDLNVAVFVYLPDASTALEKLEEVFEQKFPKIDIDFELWDPYKDDLDADGVKQISDFDVVEIDVCRIQELIGGHVGGIEELPEDLRCEGAKFVGPAKAVLTSDVGKYVVPHWVCGNFLLVQTDNKAGLAANTFDELIAAIDPGQERPLHAAMGGKSGLGELYADALCDLVGPAKAREHLIQLASAAKPTLDEEAKNRVVKLAMELTEDNRKRKAREYFDDHSYVHPRRFAVQPQSFLLGYSERLYYAERELQENAEAELPVWKADNVIVRQFPFADTSRGTPCWTDGFVIPKGKLTAAKKDAIHKFLEFVTSNEAYLAFADPTGGYLAAGYLLPASAAAYDDATMKAKQPLLAKFQPVIDESFPIYEVKVFQGLRNAGQQLNEQLLPQ